MAGYRLRKDRGDYIRPDRNRGRFHAHILNRHVIDIHYDLYVGDLHWSPHMPVMHNEERKRILRRIASFKFRDLDPGEFARIVDKF